MNKVFIGFTKHVELPASNFLLIADEVPNNPRARVFDPLKSHFNPVKDLKYKEARDLATVLYTTTPQGENTLTVRNGKRALLHALLKARRFDYIQGHGEHAQEVDAMISDILTSPTLRRILTTTTPPFSFNKNAIIYARINRAELGDFDALVLGLLIMSFYKGQLVIPDMDFYGRDIHTSLIRQNRLIAGISSLSRLPLLLRDELLSVKDKTASGALYDDAVLLAKYAGLAPHTNGFIEFVDAAMSDR